MIDVFSRSRPPTEGARVVPVVGNLAELPAEGPAIVVAAATGDRVSGGVTPASDPLTANVHWADFPAQVQVAAEAPRGWTSVVSMGDRVLIARQDTPSRRVWIGYDSSAWAGSTDFVILWANVFAWVGHGQERYENHPLSEFVDGWKPSEWPESRPTPEPGKWPGLYQSSDGALRAFAADTPAIGAPAKTTPDWRGRLARADQPADSAYDLSAVLLVVALACLAGAAGTWKRNNLTPVSAARTF